MAINTEITVRCPYTGSDHEYALTNHIFSPPNPEYFVNILFSSTNRHEDAFLEGYFVPNHYTFLSNTYFKHNPLKKGKPFKDDAEKLSDELNNLSLTENPDAGDENQLVDDYYETFHDGKSFSESGLVKDRKVEAEPCIVIDNPSNDVEEEMPEEPVEKFNQETTDEDEPVIDANFLEPIVEITIPKKLNFQGIVDYCMSNQAVAAADKSFVPGKTYVIDNSSNIQAYQNNQGMRYWDSYGAWTGKRMSQVRLNFYQMDILDFRINCYYFFS